MATAVGKEPSLKLIGIKVANKKIREVVSQSRIEGEIVDTADDEFVSKSYWDF